MNIAILGAGNSGCALAADYAARGHEVENHSTTHPQMSKLSEAKIIEEQDLAQPA